MGRVLDPLLCVFGWYTKCRYRCLHACVCLVYRADMHNEWGLKKTLWWVRSSVCVCVCEREYLHICVCVLYRADLYTVLGLLNGHCGSGPRP